MGNKKYNQGFTMIELCIVVTIIGILAAIAIPDFLRFQAKSRQTEAQVILGSLVSAQMQHKLRTGVFVSCPVNPPEPRGQWNNSMPEWNRIGFGAMGNLMYQYEVVADETGFVAYARANIDSDATIDVWEVSSRSISPKLITDDVRE